MKVVILEIGEGHATPQTRVFLTWEQAIAQIPIGFEEAKGYEKLYNYFENKQAKRWAMVKICEIEGMSEQEDSQEIYTCNVCNAKTGEEHELYCSAGHGVIGKRKEAK